MILAIPVDDAGLTAPGWGRAHSLAVADAAEGAIAEWTVHEVAWDVAHDEGTEGSHHARVARFLIENGVQGVVAEHMGDGMVRMLTTMGLTLDLGASGDARAAVLAASARIDGSHG